ncbi:Putative LOC101858828 [Caligus rogercresseyi]|uniref:LOC101858828 n=1 Tax=Caligus rogercresseyi TaxID=217165 RepID=A0A7T8QU97_CALRO|nr:Putative LOC101858828 [Caligus rogercresseyi]
MNTPEQSYSGLVYTDTRSRCRMCNQNTPSPPKKCQPQMGHSRRYLLITSIWMDSGTSSWEIDSLGGLKSTYRHQTPMERKV